MTGTEAYQQLMQKALAASQANDVESALLLWSEACRCEPLSATPHLLIGAELAQCGRTLEAESAFASAILLQPSLNIARFQLGLLQFTGGRVGVALLTWQPILEAEERDPLRLFVQGFALLAQNDLTAARYAFEEGIAHNTDNAPLNADIRMVLAKMQESSIPSQASETQPAPSGVDAASPNSEEHILLANYQQLGLPH